MFVADWTLGRPSCGAWEQTKIMVESRSRSATSKTNRRWKGGFASASRTRHPKEGSPQLNAVRTTGDIVLAEKSCCAWHSLLWCFKCHLSRLMVRHVDFFTWRSICLQCRCVCIVASAVEPSFEGSTVSRGTFSWGLKLLLFRCFAISREPSPEGSLDKVSS